MCSAVSSTDRSSAVGVCGAHAGLSAPAALLLLLSPHPCRLFMLRKLVAYHSHLMQLFKDMPWVPKCWMASFHFVWFIEPKCVIRPSLPVLLSLVFFMETAPDIWIGQETEVAAVALFLLHSLHSLSCKFMPLACTLYQAAVLLTARGALIFAAARRSLAWAQSLVYTTWSHCMGEGESCLFQG